MIDRGGHNTYRLLLRKKDRNDPEFTTGKLLKKGLGIEEQYGDFFAIDVPPTVDQPWEIKERDIQILWSRDGTKCAVAIWGRMRGVIDLANNRQVAAPMNNPASPAIADTDWLRSFDKYMDQEKFIRARQRFWKEKVKEYDPDALPRPEDETPIETNFIVFDKGLDDLFAVFEDDGDTGYLYVFAVADQQIRQRVQIYDKAKILNVVPEDVRVVWSADGAKCGVIIWNKMRGIIDRVKNQEGRVKLDGRESPGIGDKEWLKGFDLFRESDHSIQ